MGLTPNGYAFAKDYICPACKKRFVMRCEKQLYGWQIQYRNRQLYFCSYSCMRKIEVPRMKRDKKQIERELAGKVKIEG